MGLIQPYRVVHPSVHCSKGSPSSSKNLTFLEKRIRNAPTIPGTTTKKPPTWRDLDDHAQAVFAFLGLQAHGPVTGFTAHLSEAVNARAYAQGKPGPWLHKLLREQIDKAFDRHVDFVMNVEEIRTPVTGDRRLHAHGVFGLDLRSRRHADKARDAMRAAFGTWDRPSKGHQIEFKHEIDVGWASYAAKSARWATPFMRTLMASAGHMSLAPSFAGSVMTMTHRTTRLAKATAEKARQIVIEARQRPAVTSKSVTALAPTKPRSEPLRQSALNPVQTRRLYPRLIAILVLPICPHLLRIDQHGPDPPAWTRPSASKSVLRRPSFPTWSRRCFPRSAPVSPAAKRS